MTASAKRAAFACLATVVSLAANIPSANAQAAANAVSLGAKAITIDTTSCSPENSADGKSRAMVAINSGTASSATLQFSTLTPPAGTYTTVADEDALGAGKVILAVAGSAFGGVFMAKPGQSVTLTRTGPRYGASYSGLALVDMMTKKPITPTTAGSFGCQ